MRGNLVAKVVISIVLGFAGAGCIAIGGSDRYESKCPTTGKQLQDLKIAKDSGAINDEEYQRTKTKLLENPRGT
jgi:hypothetical protein